jgi:thiamine-monophosphate kinase
MDEREALAVLADRLPAAGDDAAVVDDFVVTTDMLHERTDFPDGTTPYTAGWRAVGASLSDVAAMGAPALGAVAAYGAPAFDREALLAFVDGASDVCAAVDAEYVGGDLDGHEEFTVATTAFGRTDSPVRRSGAAPGEAICVTGALGRTAAALRRFEDGDVERGNELFRFTPRIAAGCALASDATAMMDISDGLARSLHQLAEASNVGVDIAWTDLPVAAAVDAVARDEADRRELATFVGEDFELVLTLPADRVTPASRALSVPLSVVGEVREIEAGVTADGDPLSDQGFTHSTDSAE